MNLWWLSKECKRFSNWCERKCYTTSYSNGSCFLFTEKRHLAENWDIDNALLKAEELEVALKLLLRFPTKVTNQVNEENCLHASTIFRASRNCVTTAAAPRLLHNVQNTLDRLYWSNISKVQKYTRWKTLNFLVGKICKNSIKKISEKKLRPVITQCLKIALKSLI